MNHFEALSAERGADSQQRIVRRCGNCIHFGELKGIRGTVVNQVCLAPVTTEPPPNGVTAAKYRFVYVTSVNGECELHTPNVADETRRE